LARTYQKNNCYGYSKAKKFQERKFQLPVLETVHVETYFEVFFFSQQMKSLCIVDEESYF